ncbi:MAG: DUF3515 domain-containing protein [Pseudonocardiaceae bacterium]
MTRAAQPVGAPRWPLGIALAVALALVAGVLIAAAVVRGQRPDPLLVPAAAAPAAESAGCARLLAALPQQLDAGVEGRLKRRELIAPAPSGTAAWGEPAVVLRCGLERPAELTATSRLLVVSGVQYLRLPANDWVVVDRPVYIAVTLPPELGTGPIQQITEVVAQTLPAREVDVSH